MASILPSGDKWRALIRVSGHRSESKSFRLKRDAQAWAAERERALRNGVSTSFGDLRSITVGDLLTKFKDEVTPARKGAKWESNRLEALNKEPWARMNLTQDVAAALRSWRDSRLTGVKGQTVNRDLNLLGSVFTHAIKEWGLTIVNFSHQVKRPKTEGGERDTVWTDADVKLFLDYFKFDETVKPEKSSDYIPWVILIARLTGLRRSNVCEIHAERGSAPWFDPAVPCVHYTKEYTKNGTDYDCPLSKRAVEVLRALAEHRGNRGRLIEPTADTVTTLFSQHRAELAKTHPHVKGLRLHDLRHTWTTEMVPRVAAAGASEMTMAKISGRRSVRSLFRYFNPKAADLAGLLG